MKRILLLVCIVCGVFCTETVFAATSEEAESDGYSWTSNYNDGTGNHYMMNLPITDWKSSAPPGALTGGNINQNYLIQYGSFINNPVTWKWSDLNRLSVTHENPWQIKYVNGKPYNYTIFGGNNPYGNLTFMRYDGTFHIDPEYDMSGMNFSIVPVSEGKWSYLNVDVYVFIYPMCLKNQINDRNFMDYFVFWGGTQTIWEKSKLFHGKSGLAYRYYKHKFENPHETCQEDIDPFADFDYMIEVTNKNASSVVRHGWNQVKNRSDYDGRWGMTVVYGGNPTGVAYRYLVGAEFNPNQILYVGNGATSGNTQKQLQNYGQTVNIQNNCFKKDGYIFTGWNTRADGSGTWYQPGVPYSSVRPLKLFAQWQRGTYTITYHGNGATSGSTAAQSCNINQYYTLNPNGFSRTGYTFAGWSLSPDGAVSYADCTAIYNFSTTNGANINLYAKWTANQYIIHFDPNGGTGSMQDMILTYDQMANLPANAFVKESEYGASIFAGWNVIPSTLDVLYAEQAQVVNLAGQQGAVVTLYAIWDDCPWITAKNLYYTLEQAQSGFITHEELMRHATASDREDGSPILPGYDDVKGTRFWIPDYQESDFTQFTHEGSVTETYQVQDHVGNTYEKQITVYIVDTIAVAVKPTATTRFIDEKYYNSSYENGGLEDNSIWKTKPEYAKALQKAFSNLRNDTPKQTFVYSHEQIQEIKNQIQ